MLRIAAVLALALAAACGGHKPAPVSSRPAPAPVAADPAPAPAPPASGREIDGFKPFLAAMCACRDVACADQVDNEMAAWAQNVSVIGLSDEEETQVDQDVKAYVSCSMNLRYPSADGTDEPEADLEDDLEGSSPG